MMIAQRYPKEVTNKFMTAVSALRATFATEEMAKEWARMVFPGNRECDRGNRSRFMRVFKAPETDFERAVHRWKYEDTNFNEIVNDMPLVRAGGAPKGNLSAAAGRTKSTTLRRCNSAWRALSDADRKTFLLENGLTYAQP